MAHSPTYLATFIRESDVTKQLAFKEAGWRCDKVISNGFRYPTEDAYRFTLPQSQLEDRWAVTLPEPASHAGK